MALFWNRDKWEKKQLNTIKPQKNSPFRLIQNSCPLKNSKDVNGNKKETNIKNNAEILIYPGGKKKKKSEGKLSNAKKPSSVFFTLEKQIQKSNLYYWLCGKPCKILQLVL